MSQIKNKSLFLLTLITFIFISISNTCIAQGKINIGFYELPPYISTALEKHGVIGFILEKALEGKAEIQYIPITAVRLPYLLDAEEIIAGVTTVDDLCIKSTEYKCSEVIKTISVVLAYKPEHTEFDNINSLEDLKKDIDIIGQTKENILFDKNNKPLKFKETKDVVHGIGLLALDRLKGFIINEDVFDFKKTHKEIAQTIKKTKPLALLNIRIIVRNNSKTQWILEDISDYMQKNTYDSIWLDYYMNYATVK